jgi:hypothetical protein
VYLGGLTSLWGMTAAFESMARADSVLAFATWEVAAHLPAYYYVQATLTCLSPLPVVTACMHEDADTICETLHASAMQHTRCCARDHCAVLL